MRVWRFNTSQLGLNKLLVPFGLFEVTELQKTLS